MSLFGDDPPDGGGVGNEFSTPRSPQSGKRTLSDVSPSFITQYDNPKRLQTESLVNISDRHSDRDNYCDLVAQATTYLAKINEFVADQGSRMNISNKTAIMDLTQRVTGIVSLLAIKSSCNETKLANMERDNELLRNRSRITPPTISKPMSYADSLKLRLPPKSAPALVEARAPLPCVIAYPTSERSAEYASSSATKQALMNAIKPSDDGFQIVGVKKTSKSGVVLRVANESQLKKLESVNAIKSAGLRLEKPKGRKPRILVKDVPGSMEDNAFTIALYRQNIKDEIKITEDDFIKSTKITRRRKLDNGRKWIGLEIEPEVRKHLVATKEKLFIDWATCRFVDDVEVVRCLRCQQFGHVHKFCTSKSPSCANCAGDHETRDCPDKNTPDFVPTCVACKRFKKPCDHRCGSRDCTTYKMKLEQLILNTTY